MPDLPSDSVEVERAARAALVTLFTGIAGLPHVLDRAIYLDSEAEYVREFGYVHPATQDTEFRLLEIVFADFRDGEQGCDDKPDYTLNYSLTLIVSHADKRPDNTSSTDDFARIVLTLRERALTQIHPGDYERLRREPLEPTGSKFGRDDELNLTRAHVATFNLSIEVSPS